MCEGKFGTGNPGGSLVERQVLPQRMTVESSGMAPDGRRGRRCVEDMMGGGRWRFGGAQGRTRKVCEGKFGTGNPGGSLVEREVLPQRMTVESSGMAPDGRRGRRCVEDMMGGGRWRFGGAQGRTRKVCEGKFGTGNPGGSLVEREVLPQRMTVESSGMAPDGRRGRRCVEDMIGEVERMAARRSGGGGGLRTATSR